MEKKVDLKVGQKILLTIRKIGINGEGIGYYKKKAIFVKGAIVGDVVNAEITNSTATLAYAKVVGFKERSRNHVKPFCAFYEKCGGCNMMHMNYEAQLDAKRLIVEEAFERYAYLDEPVIVGDIVGMKDPYFYRNKASLPLMFGQGKTQFGLYEEETNKIVFIDHCKTHHKFLNRIVEFIVKKIDQHKIKVYNKKSGEGCIKYVIPRIGNIDNKFQVTLVYHTFDPKLNKLADELIQDENIHSVYFSQNNGTSHEIMPNEAKFIAGKERISVRIGELTFALLPKSFFQLNTVQTEKMYRIVKEFAQHSEPQVILDAFCGVGTIGQFVAGSNDTVVGIDMNESSIIDAKFNAAMNKVHKAKYYTGKVEEVYPELVKKTGLKADLVIADPPRTGLHKDFIKLLKERKIPRFIYVSCNPATLAKDVNILRNAYEIKDIKCVDMFPQTSQVETVVLFEAKAKNIRPETFEDEYVD